MNSHRWPFRYQILALLLSIALITAVSPLLIAVPRLRASATELAYKRLRAAARIKADWIRHELQRMSNDLLVAAESGTALDTLLGFQEALEAVERKDTDGRMLAGLRTRAMNWTMPGQGARPRLRRPPPPTEWTEYERRMLDTQIYLQIYGRGYGYTNTLYADAQSGRVVYSLAKDDMFLESLASPPFSETNIGRVFDRVVKSPVRTGQGPMGFRRISSIGRIHFADFETPPNGGPPTASLAAPLFDEGRLAGVLINVIPTDAFNGIMTQREGLGETGETYLVGPDALLRTDSRIDEGSGILKRTMNSQAVAEALAGREGQAVIEDYRGVAALAVWMPVQVFDTQWALIAQMDQTEVYGFIGENVRRIALWSGAMAVLLVFVCLAFAGKVDRPLAALVRRARLLAEGREVPPVDLPVSGREMHELVETFQEMAEKIRDRTAALDEARLTAEASAEEAMRANEVKTEFLNIASHDLKSPLTVVLGAASLTKHRHPIGSVVTQTHHDLADRIIARAQQMQSIVEDFLEMHALEDGQLKLEYDLLNWNVAVSAVVEGNQDYAQSKDIEIHLELAEGVPPLLADAARVDQAAQNLVGNAIKYSERDTSITVRTSVEDGFAVMEVADQGPGLGEEDMKKLFMKYARLDNKPTGGEKSSGLGLAICKQLIELQGGRIGARNNPDGGATFWFSLPLPAAGA